MSNTPDPESRSVQRRKAIQKGEPAPRLEAKPVTHCQDCADKDQEIERLKERIALDATQIKGITKRSDAYAVELHDLKNAKPSPGPMGANEQ